MAQAAEAASLASGKSRAKRYEANEQRTTFADVAGIDEVKLELSEVVDFLKHPEKYLKLGGTIPRGVLLYGPPGTGKTLLARAVAGEAGVPFFSLSASEFVEMFVGVGASRVRDLFKQAKEAAPAIIFIDELDAIGRSRGSGAMGGHEEREQTLNQILTEMDGFSGAEGVIVLAATNRPEILDAALLRPGRFDRRVAVNSPDQAGRLAILKVHTRHMPLADDVDLEGLASSSPGMVGADLKNLANEAALMAARRNHERVQLADFTDALEKILLGAERKIMLTQGGTRAHGLPRVRSRVARHAPAGSGSGAKDLDHPAWPGAGRDVPVAVGRPVRLRRRVPARSHRGGPRWPGCRADRLRRRHDRRGVRPGDGHADRQADGRTVGDERGDRPGVGVAGPQRRALPAARHRTGGPLGAHARVDRQRGPQDRRRVLRRRR